MTGPLERVLRAFLADPAAPRYGYDLMKAAGLKSGTLYPLLGRLADDGLVSSAWETPQRDGERPRRYYRLTGEGVRVARIELSDLWAGIEHFLEPGREILIAHDGAGVAEFARSLTASQAQSIGERARSRVLAEHTYEHRVEELERILSVFDKFRGPVYSGTRNAMPFQRSSQMG